MHTAMRLIDTDSMRPRVFKPGHCPPYAVLSHCWKSKEIIYADLYPKRGSSALSSDDDDDDDDSDGSTESDDDDLDQPSHARSRAGSVRLDQPRHAPSRAGSIRLDHTRPARSRPSLRPQSRSRSRRPTSASAAADSDDSEPEPAGVQTPRTGVSSDTRSEISALREAQSSPAMAKFRRALHVARRANIRWIWIDSCCVNPDSALEVQQAVMGAWDIYANAHTCFVFLDDFELPEDLAEMDEERESDWKHRFCTARWFARAWTLLELLASQRRVFFDKNWDNITRACASPDALTRLLSAATRIPPEFLRGATSIFSAAPVAARMAWMAGRRSSKPEDVAYALAGLFDVHLDVRYGEGGYRAFQRLQHEILKVSVDESILCWDAPPRPEAGSISGSSHGRTGLLADSPDQFLDTADLVPAPTFLMPKRATWTMTNRGLQASLYMTPHAAPSLIGNYRRVWLNLMRRHTQQFMCFFVQQVGEADEWARVSAIEPVSTRPGAFLDQREQQTITVAQVSDTDGSGAADGAPTRGLRGTTGGGGAARAASWARPHVRFTAGSGLRQVAPHTPSHAPSWAVTSKHAECVAPVPHGDTYVAIAAVELKTPSHAPKVDAKFLVVACMRLVAATGRWYCALRVDDADDYRSEMPDMKTSAARALTDAPDASLRTSAHLGVGLDGSREIRAEVSGWIEWHEKEFVVDINCPAVAPLAAGFPSDREFSAAGHPRAARFPAQPPPSAGYPPSYAAAYPPSASAMAHHHHQRPNHLARSMSVDHGASPFVPPPSTQPLRAQPYPRHARDLSPPPSLRTSAAPPPPPPSSSRKRDSWNGLPAGMPPTPLSPPRRPLTARPGAAARTAAPTRAPGPSAHYAAYRGEYSPDEYAAGLYDAAAYTDYAEAPVPRARADSGRSQWLYWDRAAEASPGADVPATPSRRSTRTPAHAHSQSFGSGGGGGRYEASVYEESAYEAGGYEREGYRERTRERERERERERGGRDEYAGYRGSVAVPPPPPPVPMPSSLFMGAAGGALGISVGQAAVPSSGRGSGRGGPAAEFYGEEEWYGDGRGPGLSRSMSYGQYGDGYEY